MSYSHFETDCFILHGRNLREANRFLLLLSREFGPIWAEAQGVRKLQSKLRYNLQPFSKTKVTLIQGREVWRVVGARESVSYFELFKNEDEYRRLLQKLFTLSAKLLVGEEPRSDFFVIIDSVVLFLNEKNDLTGEQLFALELFVVAQMLHTLGYLPDTLLDDSKLRQGITADALEVILEKKDEFLLSVNTALNAAPI